MPLDGYNELYAEADARKGRVSAAAAGGADKTVLEALRAACDRGWVKPIVAGPVREIKRIARESRIDLEDFQLIDAVDDEASAIAATAEVKLGRADLLMKGLVSTPSLMEAVLDPERGLRSGRSICQVVLIELEDPVRRFLMADTGIMVKPAFAHKTAILRAAIEVAWALGERIPKVAMMAATEKVSATMPETIEAAEIVRRSATGEFGACKVQGPLSFDLALAADAGEKKRIGGEVIGAADVLIFPNLVSANLTVKAIMYTAPCRFGGVLRGTTKPVVFMSRSDTTCTRMNSLALALRIASRIDGGRS